MFRELREKSGITQKTLACRLTLDQTTISKWETGNAVPKITMVSDIAKALGVTVEEVVACFTKKGV